MSDETVFLSGNDIYVSNSRVSIGGTTYSTANLTSVSRKITPAKTGCALLLIVFGGLGLIGSLFTGESFVDIIGAFLTSAVIIAIGTAWLSALKPMYHVILSSASGESRALSSKDQKLIDSVVEAINRAIVYRG